MESKESRVNSGSIKEGYLFAGPKKLASLPKMYCVLLPDKLYWLKSRTDTAVAVSCFIQYLCRGKWTPCLFAITGGNPNHWRRRS